ncbi:hypothetical protein [Bifidobacterium felsineum]|uniref:PhnA protein n=1 Tax=Bifidobacterium felsineum TaxID=2045440 RepID=A0A2M9HJG9_9BIFI|nr:hypothetical protein [Bifidobacterium felsineum]PJM76955.1 hypothetical protein CSQ86_07625 [Bifidobacterium felsineum]
MAGIETSTRQFQKDLRSLEINWSAIDMVANRQVSIDVQMSDRHSSFDTTSIPLNMDAFQLLQDIDRFTREIARLMGLHSSYNNLSTPRLLKNVRDNLSLLDMMPVSTVQKLANNACKLVERLVYLLNPPESTRMIGWCPDCNYELRADERELAGGWLECSRCRTTHRVKDIHELDMLRLRLSGVKGTPAQLHRLFKPWGIDIKAGTIRTWGHRGIIKPIEHNGNAPVYLIWDIWQAHTRFAGYNRARRHSKSRATSV